MSTITEIEKQNEELAKKINEETLRNPRSPYAGKFVGIANGQVVAVTDDLNELARLLDQAEPDPRKVYWVEASRDHSEVHEIWSLR